MRPYQFYLSNYPFSKNKKYPRKFQYSWFAQFSTWLEYSPTTDVAYCLPYYLFASKPNGPFGANAYTVAGFRNWKKISYTTAELIIKNRLRVKTLIDCVWGLACQSCPFQGHDEGPKSTNPGNFIEMVKLLASYNDKVSETVLEKAPHNAKYTSGKIQKEILHINATKERTKFVKILVVFFKNIFFDILSTILSHHAFSVANLRGQGYDGASNMRLSFRLVKGANQIGTLQRTGNTRWGSHFSSICSLIKIITVDGANFSQRGDFVFILILMKELMRITDVLCQGLQQKSQDILNAMNLVSMTKQLLQKLRDNGWDNIKMPHMNDTQLKELNCRFCDQTVELLTLSLALDPSNSNKSFNADDISTLVEKYYSQDFTEREIHLLKFQLQHYYLDFFGDCMPLHVERDIADTFNTNSIIEDFYTMEDR
ncbi:hypothetical protein ABFS83_13G039100 [Erythranthe nasuta]